MSDVQNVGIEKQVILRANEHVVVACSCPYLQWPVSLVDSCGSLVAGNCEELEPVLVVEFCHVHQVRHFHAGFGQLSEECTDKLVQVKEPVFVMLRIPIVRSDVVLEGARCPRQMTLRGNRYHLGGGLKSQPLMRMSS